MAFQNRLNSKVMVITFLKSDMASKCAKIMSSSNKWISFQYRHYGDSPLYSKIPLLRPPKIRTFYLLKTLFLKFKLFFIFYTQCTSDQRPPLGLSKSGL